MMPSAAAPHRVGHPSPLIFHLSTAVGAYQAALLAAPAATGPDFPWHAAMERPTGAAPGQLATAAEAGRRLQRMLDGIERWQRHPYRRAMAEPSVLWQAGATRLMDYGLPGAGGLPVLVIPSLINRAHILDLHPERSFLRHLAEQGLRPVLVDWGVPGRAEQGFDLERHVAARLLPAAAFVQGLTGRAPALLGYCMGGTLAVALAATLPGTPALVTIGAPWDFSPTGGLAADLRAMVRRNGREQVRAAVLAIADAFGAVPATVFQHLFALINPIGAARKFQTFAAAPSDSLETTLFVALEDWLADGVSMTGPAAVDLLIGWHLDNAPATGRWSCLGAPVRADRIACRALVLAGRRDTIATPAMAEPLARAIPGAGLRRPDLGHVGMIVSRRAPQEVWTQVVAFLSDST